MIEVLSENQSSSKLSPEMRQLLAEEAAEAEILAAIDAAFEEGLLVTREEAIDILNEARKNLPPDTNS